MREIDLSLESIKGAVYRKEGTLIGGATPLKGLIIEPLKGTMTDGPHLATEPLKGIMTDGQMTIIIMMTAGIGK